MKTVLLVFGTRPEIIKLAPLVRAFEQRAAQVELKLCSSGQHKELLANCLQSFSIEPDFDLALMQDGQAFQDFLARLLPSIRPILREVKPDFVIVQGDTTTALGAAMAAFYEGIAVAHVEAGLRSGDPRSPFPEELNRRAIAVFVQEHFAPTKRAKQALMRENHDPAHIHVTGNTGIDSLFWILEEQRGRELPACIRDVADRDRVVLVTAHRRESFGAPLEELCHALHDLSREVQDLRLIFPVHPNPQVRRPVEKILAASRNIPLLDPLPYPELIRVLERSSFVITDSGGLQEEAPSIGKPVLVCREKTERREGIEAGVAKLVGCSRDRILRAAKALLEDQDSLKQMSRVALLYGDGRAAERIVDHLLDRPVRLRVAAK